MAIDTMDTTSAGMPPIATPHSALDTLPEPGRDFRGTATAKARGIADEGKAQVTATIDGLVAAARDIAAKLESTGGAPVARYAHQAADTLAGWSTAVDNKSVEELLDDTRTLVRTSPAIAVGLAVVAGFAASRFLKASPTSRGY